MSHPHHPNLGDPPSTSRETPKLMEVHGWASDNYRLGGAPPVIVNPEADALSLLSWGLGQLQQCNAFFDALGEYGTDNADSTARFIGHFNKQAELVLRAGIEKLFAAQVAAHRSAAVQ